MWIILFRILVPEYSKVEAALSTWNFILETWTGFVWLEWAQEVNGRLVWIESNVIDRTGLFIWDWDDFTFSFDSPVYSYYMMLVCVCVYMVICPIWYVFV